jgi:hypothetical protein
MKQAPNLSEDEVKYFYGLLYLLERKTYYEGFNIQRIDTEVRKIIKLNSNFGKNDYVPKPKEKNVLNFKGKSKKTKHLLKHIRNSFAHGFLESRGNDFYILDVPTSKTKELNKEKNASMIGTMNKITFYKLIKAILNTNPLTKE